MEIAAMNVNRFTLAALLLAPLAALPSADMPNQAWEPAAAPLMTQWGKTVSPNYVLPEYPRPTMVRTECQNLNELGDYAVTAKDAGQSGQCDGKILVPFCIESALSGVMKPLRPEQRLWYRRTFTVPKEWNGQRILLHFGAVDWQTTVFLNGRELGGHRGGYDGFTCDITSALKPGDTQELVVSVWDPTDTSCQLRGKQTSSSPSPSCYWHHGCADEFPMIGNCPTTKFHWN
jgi:hypothetical protein